VSGKCTAQKVARKAKLGDDPVSASAGGSGSATSGSGSASAPPSVAPGSLVVDASGFDHTCKVKADCKIVKADPCDKCSCADKAIAARDVARFEKAQASIKCPSPSADKRRCGECRGFLPACESGQCVAKPE
jgi:hypothetical protein